MVVVITIVLLSFRSRQGWPVCCSGELGRVLQWSLRCHEYLAKVSSTLYWWTVVDGCWGSGEEKQHTRKIIKSNSIPHRVKIFKKEEVDFLETSKINRKRNYYNYGQVTGDFLNFYAWQWNFCAFILFSNWNCRWQWIVSSPHVQRNSKRSISCEQIWTNCSVQCYHAGYRFPWWPQLDNLPCSQWYCGRNVDSGQNGERLTTSCVFHTAGRLIPNSDVGLFRHSYHQIFYSRFWYDIMSTVILSVSLKSKCFDSMRSIRFVFIGIRPASRQWSTEVVSSVTYWQSKVCSEDIGFSVFLEFV